MLDSEFMKKVLQDIERKGGCTIAENADVSFTQEQLVDFVMFVYSLGKEHGHQNLLDELDRQHALRESIPG